MAHTKGDEGREKMTLRELVELSNVELPQDLIAYVGIGYKYTDPVSAVKPTPQSWDWPMLTEFMNDMNADQRQRYMRINHHRVSVRTVIHERYAMLAHRTEAGRIYRSTAPGALKSVTPAQPAEKEKGK